MPAYLSNAFVLGMPTNELKISIKHQNGAFYTRVADPDQCRSMWISEIQIKVDVCKTVYTA